MERLTLEENTKRWKCLFEIEQLTPTDATTRTTNSESSNSRPGQKRKRSAWSTLTKSTETNINLECDNDEYDDNDKEDPFECKSMAVLPTYNLVENTIQEYLTRWKQLDDRKIRRTILKKSANNDDTQEEMDLKPRVNPASSVATAKTITCGWRSKEDRLQLPEQFDYATTQSQPPVDDEYSGRRVICLENPTKTLSYHTELWKLFSSIPTSQELEYEARNGHKLNNTMNVHNETLSSIGTSADYHALSRLRMADRHGMPPEFIYELDLKKNDVSKTDLVETIRLECWRRQPKRGSSPDSNRLVLEFRSNQTLWDVHMALIQLLEDELWEINITDGDTTSQDKAGENNNKISTSSTGPSGCFFIEDSFYTTGPVNYAEPIVDWIDGYNSKPNPARRRYLGISTMKSLRDYKNIKEIKLDQVPFRLGIRYYHACHGDVETSIMLSDRRVIRNPSSKHDKLAYPLIHDVWSCPRVCAHPMCDACNTYHALFATSTECKTTDGGPRALCQNCCKELRVIEREPEAVKFYNVWRNEADLSIEIAREFATLF